jgi:hypothetical protein
MTSATPVQRAINAGLRSTRVEDAASVVKARVTVAEQFAPEAFERG